jgi:hypothetical protein
MGLQQKSEEKNNWVQQRINLDRKSTTKYCTKISNTIMLNPQNDRFSQINVQNQIFMWDDGDDIHM